MILLLASNCLLALERYHILSSSVVPRSSIIILFGSGLMFFAAISISLCITPNGLAYQLAPFIMPGGTNENIPEPLTFPETYLFLIGITYFPLIILITCAIYVRSYFQATKKYQEEITELELDLAIKAFENSITPNPILNEKNTSPQHLQILLRCSAMSFGLILFYVPPIICVSMRMFGAQAFWEDEDNVTRMAWVYSVMSILPSCDAVYTPVCLMVLMKQYRRVVGKCIKDLIQ
ncbi:hypothetical protein BCR33DRAFT_211878 [Rhizoclosmatium globosum]|uniref:G-protein coupled receptors family 1 profile domain-containing protein n=1 Tax=Rhizoclosmatium globosum TaxID=329046 RepID=A0A1Y2CCY2_9FUNG|nr:hypothetical protein BCR33DRAFT_211878 [Rhizoclosmatium globosum]|eukprot:ORY44893.1 hypothetical protein BCR33DRAFT_211878 [Rhizoclosmatium globosum]